MSIDKQKEAEDTAEYFTKSIKQYLKDAYYTGWDDCQRDLFQRAECMMKAAKEGENK